MSLLGTVIGDYKILRKIGSGGMGVVYQGVHVRLDQPVAIKDLAPELASDPEMRQRFIREARIQAQLNHPNVVNVHNLLEHEGRLLLVMEFVEGETLDKLIQDRGALPYDKAIDITRQVLDALSFMHAKGVIHRDLKPGNIMLAEGNRVKVTDFGIAKAIKEKGQTRAGVRLGTLWYMSPEQIKGKPVDARSDLYAMGVTLFQMVTGKLPFFGNSDFEIMKAHTEVAPPDPKKVKKDIPKPLSGIILKLLEKDPDKRFQSANEVLKSLNAINIKEVHRTPERSFKKDKAQKNQKPKKSFLLKKNEKAPAWIWILIAALLVIAGGIILTYWFLNRKSSVIPVVKEPRIEKKVVSVPSPGTSAPETAPEEEKTPPEDGGKVAPILEEIEQKGEKSPNSEKTEEKKAPSKGKGQEQEKASVKNNKEKNIGQPLSSSGKNVAEMNPSGSLNHTPAIHSGKGKTQKKKPSVTHHTKQPRSTVEMSPDGSIRREKKHVASSHSGTGARETSQHKKGEKIIINKRLGYFFKSLKKSLKELEHTKGKGTSKPSSNDEGNNDLDDAFRN